MKRSGICAIPRTEARSFRRVGVPGFANWIAARWDVANRARKSRGSLQLAQRRGPWQAVLRHAGLPAQHTAQMIQAHFNLNLHLRFARLLSRRAAAPGLARTVAELSCRQTSPVTGALGAAPHHLPFILRENRGMAWHRTLTTIQSQWRELKSGAALQALHVALKPAVASVDATQRLHGRTASTVADRRGALRGSLPVPFSSLTAFTNGAIRELMARAFAVLSWVPSARVIHSRLEHWMGLRLVSPGLGSSGTLHRWMLIRSHTALPSGASVVCWTQDGGRAPTGEWHLPESRQARSISMTFVRHESSSNSVLTQTLAQVQQTLSSVDKLRQVTPLAVDVPYLTRQVYDQFERELRIEKERRGL